MLFSRMALAIALAATTAVPAQAETPEEALASRFRAAAAWLDANLEKEAVPGAAIGIVHDQQLVWSHRFGVESLATQNPVTDDTLFSICSVSKLFNGIAAMNLVEEGKLDLDAPLTRYDAVMALPDNLGSEEAITARGILSHVAGVPREGALDYWGDNSFPDVDGLRASVSSQEQLYKPYDHWQYSNLGMAMLGDVVGQISGKSWGDYVDQTIFTPLGMTNSVTDMPFDRVGNGFAQGYYIRSPQGTRKRVEEHSFRAFAAAAGVASSINDMAKFASWNFRLMDQGGEEILKATTLKAMQRVHWVGADFDEPAWGLAYGTRRYDGKTMWGHGGYCPGARTEFVMRLPTKVGVMMMVSANDVSPTAMVKTVYSLTEGPIAKVHGSAGKNGATKNGTGAAPAPSIASGGPNAGPQLSAYEGSYYVANYDWDVYVGTNEDGLFAIPLYHDNPAGNLETWVHERGDVFRRKRKDDTLAEAITFERDANGQVTALTQHSYRSTKR